MYSVYLTDYNSTPNSSTSTPERKELYIYDPITHDEGLIASEPIVSFEGNKAGSFSCTIPHTNYGYNKTIKGLTRVVVKKDEKIIFMGRINEEDKDLYLNQKIIAEGALAYLNDTLTDKVSLVNKTLYELISYILNHHNSRFTDEPWKQFHLVDPTTYSDYSAKFVGRNNPNANADTLAQYNLNFDNSMEVVSELVELANGVLKYDYNEEYGWWNVYIYNKFTLPVTSNQPIEFGLNLLDLVQSTSYNNIASVVAPFGGDLIQTSKEIGEVVASNDVNTYIEEAYIPGTSVKDIYNHCMWRQGDDPNYNYAIYDAGEYSDSGYWAFAFDIGAYNNAHPNNHIKRLYLSWRAYKFTTVNNYIADNAWRIYERIWDDDLGDYVYQTLGFKELTNDDGEFESAINEVIDLTDPQYKGANWIRMGGWGGLITPLIRRDATVVEGNDKLSIEPCTTFEHVDGLTHPVNDKFYLYSDSLLNLYGRVEKKLEYDINDENKPLTTYHGPIIGNLGNISKYEGYALGYEIEYDEEQNPNFEKHKGEYNIIELPNSNEEPYCCYEYVLPDLGDPYRPRGVFVTSRMHELGIEPYNNKNWQVDGMYVLLDESDQVLSYKTAAKSDKGFGFTNIYREYIDLSDAQNFGAKKIRVGGYFGGDFTVELYPSDDIYSANRLMDQAKLYLTSYQWEKVVIEASAVDLSMTSKEWDDLDYCSSVSVTSQFHGVDAMMPITALELHLDKFEDNTIKLGYDNDEYLSTQLSDTLRVLTNAQSDKERSTT